MEPNQQTTPAPKQTTRSKIFGLLGLALIAVGSAQLYTRYEAYHAKEVAAEAERKANEPVLLGTCWAIYNKVLLSFVATPTVSTEAGPEKAYGTVMRVGPLALPKLLPIRKTNEDIAAMKKSGQAVEVNCMSGEPVDAKGK